MWNGSLPIGYPEKHSSHSPRTGQPGVFQENLPSISSVLSSE